jgi:hypothetical protein
VGVREGVPGKAASYVLRIPLGKSDDDGSSNFVGVGSGLIRQQTNVASAGVLTYQVAMPASGRVSRVAVRCTGSGSAGTHAGVPATKPTVSLIQGISGSTVATATDSSASSAAYNAAHWIESTGLTHLIDSTEVYALVLTGETGANSSADKLQFLFAELTIVPV